MVESENEDMPLTRIKFELGFLKSNRIAHLKLLTDLLIK
jgi:hypothetical protein